MLDSAKSFILKISSRKQIYEEKNQNKISGLCLFNQISGLCLFNQISGLCLFTLPYVHWHWQWWHCFINVLADNTVVVRLKKDGFCRVAYYCTCPKYIYAIVMTKIFGFLRRSIFIELLCFFYIKIDFCLKTWFLLLFHLSLKQSWDTLS